MASQAGFTKQHEAEYHDPANLRARHGHRELNFYTLPNVELPQLVASTLSSSSPAQSQRCGISIIDGIERECGGVACSLPLSGRAFRCGCELRHRHRRAHGRTGPSLQLFALPSAIPTPISYDNISQIPSPVRSNVNHAVCARHNMSYSRGHRARLSKPPQHPSLPSTSPRNQVPNQNIHETSIPISQHGSHGGSCMCYRGDLTIRTPSWRSVRFQRSAASRKRACMRWTLELPKIACRPELRIAGPAGLHIVPPDA